MNRAEHLAWAKTRALEYVDRGDLQIALASMVSDVSKHPELDTLNNRELVAIGALAVNKGPDAVRRWIEEFA